MNTKLTKTTTSFLLCARALVSLVAVAIALAMSGAALAESEAQVCGPQTLHGSYAFSAHGFTIVNGAAQPLAIVEKIQFNGDGTASVPFATLSINGFIVKIPPGGLGTYTLEPDCTGTLTFDGPINLDIVVRPNGKEFWMIQTDANTVLEARVERVGR